MGMNRFQGASILVSLAALLLWSTSERTYAANIAAAAMPANQCDLTQNSRATLSPCPSGNPNNVTNVPSGNPDMVAITHPAYQASRSDPGSAAVPIDAPIDAAGDLRCRYVNNNS